MLPRLPILSPAAASSHPPPPPLRRRRHLPRPLPPPVTTSFLSRPAPTANFVASALSDMSIVLYDARVGVVIDWVHGAHDGPISDIEFFTAPSSLSPSSLLSLSVEQSMMSLISSGHNGCIKVWDFRCRHNGGSNNLEGGAQGQQRVRDYVPPKRRHCVFPSVTVEHLRLLGQTAREYPFLIFVARSIKVVATSSIRWRIWLWR